MTPRPGSTDDGPQFLSDLIREFHHLQRQQQGLESKLRKFSEEHTFTTRRLDAIETTLRAIGIREGDLATDAALQEGRRIAQRNQLMLLLPIAGVLLAVLLSLLGIAVRHALIEEHDWGGPTKPPPQYGPPVPPRLQQKP